MCALNAVLFWGGWLPFFDWEPLYAIPGIFWFFLKIMIFFFMFSWVKATVPRFRYDQLMRLGWKIFLPFSLLWVFVVSGWLLLTRDPCPGTTNGLTVSAPLLRSAEPHYFPSCRVPASRVEREPAGATQ
jgi:NADH-quinone oxidoreductase subunit H